MEFAVSIVHRRIKRAGGDQSGERRNRDRELQPRGDLFRSLEKRVLQFPSNFNGMADELGLEIDVANFVGDQLHCLECLRVSEVARGEGPDIAERHRTTTVGLFASWRFYGYRGVEHRDAIESDATELDWGSVKKFLCSQLDIGDANVG